MRFSHSKLKLLLNNPVEYFLKYEKGINLIDKKPALAIGSAVHWGIEHDTDDLLPYYEEEGSFFQKDNYTKDQAMAEALVTGYLKEKDGIYADIMEKGGLSIIDEYHELDLDAKLKSYVFMEDHEFNGIIDLLLLTDKGFVIIDYKTSSREPDWDSYLDQLYRYVYLLKANFPDTPVYKIGIICLRKASIRPRKGEMPEDFNKRLKVEYATKSEEYITYKVFDSSYLEQSVVDEYIRNLSHTCDCAQMIVENKFFFCNHSNMQTVYGKSDYWDFVYKTDGGWLKYSIKDKWYDEETGEIADRRTCVDIDFLVLDEHNNILINSYDVFETVYDAYLTSDFDGDFESFLGKWDDGNARFVYNKSLLENYEKTYAATHSQLTENQTN